MPNTTIWPCRARSAASMAHSTNDSVSGMRWSAGSTSIAVCAPWRSAQSSADRDVRAGFKDIGVAHDSVAEQVELGIEGGKVVEALSGLPEAQREALVLAYYGGYSQNEIAALVGAPLGTIKTRMRDGLTRLRTAMGVTA